MPLVSSGPALKPVSMTPSSPQFSPCPLTLGCTGLEELLGIETAFLEFQDTLFSSASLTMERSVQSREVNKKLDAGISLFLTRLCPYLLLKPAHKCLEWLIHRYSLQSHLCSVVACSRAYIVANV